MNFARPEYLFLLGLIPILGIGLALAEHRRRADLARLGDPDLIRRLNTGLMDRGHWMNVVLWLLAAALVITASARPQWGQHAPVKSSQGTETILLLDVSASMLAEDTAPDRLTAAKQTGAELIDQSQGDIGLVIFSGAAFVQFPLTNDKQTAQFLLKHADPDSITRPGSSLDEAIQIASNAFTKERSSGRIILLLTDGEYHQGDPFAAAANAAEAGITIHCIGYGSLGGAPIPVRDYSGSIVAHKADTNADIINTRLNENILQKIADQTGGKYIRSAEDPSDVAALLDEIVTSQVEESQGVYKAHPIERFAWFSIASLFFLSAETLLRDRRRRE